MAEVEIDDRRIRAALHDLHRAVGDLSPAFREIGEVLVESSKKRFETGTGPDGNPWAENKPSTIARKGSGKPPLIDSGTLMNEIHFRLVGNDELEINNPMEYAAMMQFGGTKAEFPHLWNDIPARPFFGISDDDEDAVLAIIRRHLENAI